MLGRTAGAGASVEHEARCRVLDTLQKFSLRGRESSQERDAVVEAGNGQRLN